MMIDIPTLHDLEHEPNCVSSKSMLQRMKDALKIMQYMYCFPYSSSFSAFFDGTSFAFFLIFFFQGSLGKNVCSWPSFFFAFFKWIREATYAGLPSFLSFASLNNLCQRTNSFIASTRLVFVLFNNILPHSGLPPVMQKLFQLIVAIVLVTIPPKTINFATMPARVIVIHCNSHPSLGYAFTWAPRGDKPIAFHIWIYMTSGPT